MEQGRTGSGWCGRLVLAGAALAVQWAGASTLTEYQNIEAWTVLSEPQAPGGGPQGVTWHLGQPPGPVTVVSSERGSTVAAAARQTPDGFFHTVATQSATWADGGGERVAVAQTLFQVTVSTNTPDTPLLLDFLFLGSRLEAGVHYGVGTLTASTTLHIAGGVGNGSAAAAPLVWGFSDQLQLAGNGNFEVPASTAVDVQGLGLPIAQTSRSWVNFESTAQINRSSFGGTLDFGLLQPGERFALQYVAESRITSRSPYPLHARAEVIDPFSLRGDPPLQLQLRGLTLPSPVGVVPEPATAAQVLGGGLLLALLAWRRQRRGVRRAHAAPLLLALAATTGPARAEVLDYPVPDGNFYGDQPGVLDVHHRVTHLGSNIDGLDWWAGGYDDLSGVAWSSYNSAGTLAYVDLRVLNGQPLRLDGFRLGSWAGAEGKLETVTVTAIGSTLPAWQFTGLIGVGNLANSFQLGLVSTTGFTITWTNPWWTAIDDIRFQTSAVPEPAGAWLLLAGLPWLWARQRRHAGPQAPR